MAVQATSTDAPTPREPDQAKPVITRAHLDHILGELTSTDALSADLDQALAARVAELKEKAKQRLAAASRGTAMCSYCTHGRERHTDLLCETCALDKHCRVDPLHTYTRAKQKPIKPTPKPPRQLANPNPNGSHPNGPGGTHTATTDLMAALRDSIPPVPVRTQTRLPLDYSDLGQHHGHARTGAHFIKGASQTPTGTSSALDIKRVAAAYAEPQRTPFKAAQEWHVRDIRLTDYTMYRISRTKNQEGIESVRSQVWYLSDPDGTPTWKPTNNIATFPMSVAIDCIEALIAATELDTKSGG